MESIRIQTGKGELTMRISSVVGAILGCAVCLASALAVAMPARADNLEQSFREPPATTKPRCYWYWMDGYITKDGITKDLEAMKRVGIGEGYIGIISKRSGLPPKADPRALTDEWWAFIEHAIREGGRLGVDVGVFNSPGWSQSGGPWVKPGQAMRYVVAPETRVRGPQHFEGKLPAPPGQFQDIALLAFPAPGGEDEVAKETGRTPTTATFEMPTPFTARSVTVKPVTNVRTTAELEASADGLQYRTVKKFEIYRLTQDRYCPVPLAPVVATFPATTARFFRLNFSSDCRVGEILVSSAARVESYAEKSLQRMFQDSIPPHDFYTWPAQAEADSAALVINPQTARDLGAQMTADGVLRWDVPEGEWLVLRVAMAPTGVRNKPAPAEATGLEVDKMSRAALRAHFDAYVGKLLERMPAAERTAWKHVVADSWEVGSQNWTDDFAAEFRNVYGYDPLPWLPTMTGRIVGSAEQADRFLWDLRRLVADRVARDYTGGLRDLCNEQGLTLWLENYGHYGFPGEFLSYGGASDEIGGEFWVGRDCGPVELRAAASAAHVYGKPVVWAEAFTGGPAFANSPRDLKARGDWAFCEGINQFVLHVYIHQPWEDKKPGINAWFGTEFNRHNTWFDNSKPWIDYLRRCSVMLQAGRPVADVAYFIGEDVPKMSFLRRPELPAGYDCDYINADVLLNRAQVKDNWLVLPDGMRYRLLVLPPSKTMRPELLRKLAAFVGAGLPVFGPLPSRSPSLQHFPACDAEVKALVGELKERVLHGDDLRVALKSPPDVVCPQDILWKHRQDGDADIYFLSNQSAQERDETISFRVSDRVPALWRPDTGNIEPASFAVKDGRTAVSLRLDPAGSVFVVFRKQRPDVAMKKHVLRKHADVPGPWNVEFPSKRARFDQLRSWTEDDDTEVKYFSGAATYRTVFAASRSNEQRPVILDLGRVEALATVTVNGQTFPTLWKPPYQVDITSALKSGTNELAVTVVNPWNNRLVGDQQPGVTNRMTFISHPSVSAKTPLQPSGLLGPVQLREVYE
jgi:hypothetical protein